MENLYPYLAKMVFWHLFFVFFTINTIAQEPKNQRYIPELDSLWSRTVNIENMTSDGNWVLLQEMYDIADSKMLLRHSTQEDSFVFEGVQFVNFSNNDKWFGCILPNYTLQVVNLKNKTINTYDNISSYEFSESGDYIVAQEINMGHSALKTILIIHLQTNNIERIEDVKAIKLHPKDDKFILVKKEEDEYKLAVRDMNNSLDLLITKSRESNYANLFWSKSGNSMIFTESIKDSIILNYYSVNGKRIRLSDQQLTNKFIDYVISDKFFGISDDGKRVVFYRKSIHSDSDSGKSSIEVWHSDEAWIIPKMNKYKRDELWNLLTVWYPEEGTLKAIETEEFPSSVWDINRDFALVYDKLQYEPLYKNAVNADLYIRDIEHEKNYLVTTNQYTESSFVSVSSCGNYIAYFKDRDWYLYAAKTKTTVNLTQSIDESFVNVEKDFAGDKSPYGSPGWISDKKQIVIYDQYDVWLMAIDGSYKERITRGKEENLQNRISQNYQKETQKSYAIRSFFFKKNYIDSNGLLLEISDRDKKQTGYAFWMRGKKLKHITWGDKKVDNELIARDLSRIVYRKQRYNHSPSIHIYNLKLNKESLIYQSNQELSKYDLGKAEIITYKVDDKTLSGTLLFPVAYNPLKKYPMIVSIYEDKSGEILDFNPPSDYEYLGFNTLKYIIDGYFVLLPDIDYKINDPGLSALACVKGAVYKALEVGNINQDKIGLIGHSFGGYESAFIATQTDMFAAIVAGAAVTNFTSHYHSVSKTWNEPEMWRYENQQWRMGASYYAIKDSYARNSPINFVENVSTPIMLWSGKEDYQIHWLQSIEMFLALKRLNKTSKLILLDGEPHFVLKKSNQKKLSEGIKKWFDGYCK